MKEKKDGIPFFFSFKLLKNKSSVEYCNTYMLAAFLQHERTNYFQKT